MDFPKEGNRLRCTAGVSEHPAHSFGLLLALALTLPSPPSGLDTVPGTCGMHSGHTHIFHVETPFSSGSGRQLKAGLTSVGTSLGP